MKLCRTQGTLVTFALGSCVGICMYDPEIKLAGLLHIMLPKKNPQDKNILKYADTGIPEMIRKMEAFGAIRGRMVAKIAGGAKMFAFAAGNSAIDHIGDRNVESVKEVLRKERIRLLREDVGGNYARTLYFDVATGEAMVKTFGKGEVKL